jgi:polysaccharide export outer membrane protein
MKFSTTMQGRLSMLAAALVLAAPGLAQQQSPTLQPNPIAAMEAFEPAANQPYELGRGDEIDVEVIGRPELSGKHTVGPDGSITLPIAGSVPVADKTREQAATAIQTALSPFYAGVTVSVGVDRYTSNKILLLGAVEHPGVLTFENTPTLLEVISRGGVQLQAAATSQGGGGGANGAGPTAGPSVVPEECVIYRGNAMLTVQLKRLLDEGSPLANMRLKRDDVVYVRMDSHYVSVFGQVAHPGNLRLTPTSTLPELLAEAGGPTEKAGRNPTIQIIHRAKPDGTKGTTQSIPYKSLLKPGVLDLTIQSGDILYVPESGFNATAYSFQMLAPLVNLFTIGALVQ